MLRGMEPPTPKRFPAVLTLFEVRHDPDLFFELIQPEQLLLEFVDLFRKSADLLDLEIYLPALAGHLLGQLGLALLQLQRLRLIWT